MNRSTVAFVAGLIFAIGLGVSGMTLPAKVIGFLDIFGEWDPSLALVMLGAIGVNVLAGAVFGRQTARAHRIRRVDRRLLAGSVLFGVGWGLVGYCPGPALVALVTLQTPVLVFCAAMGAGMLLYRRVSRSD